MLLDPSFEEGMRIVGKWNKHKYRIERFLGEGSNGKVYLVKLGKSVYAMKMGFSVHDHQSEVNVLKSLDIRPPKNSYLIDVDDFHHEGKDYPFYIMPFVEGIRYYEYLKKYGSDWFSIIGKNILGRLQQLHEQGWIFGDLKMDNVLVSGYGDVNLIDYGGVTQKGRSVKQFTELYDRGYWGAGTRAADESYDLFSFAILCLQCVDNRLTLPLLPQNREPEHVMQLVRTNPVCKPLETFFYKAVHGEFSTSKQAYAEWRRLMLQRQVDSKSMPMQTNWLKGAFMASALALALTLYFAFQ
jgi:serine/threonine protein kinase